MFFSWIKTRIGRTRVLPRYVDLQHFVPGPDPAPGLIADEKRGMQFAAPALSISPMMQYGGIAQPQATINDLQWQLVLPNNNGVGAFVNARRVVETKPVEQYAHAIEAPARSWSNRRNPTRGGLSGDQLRHVMTNLVSPPRLQSVPGYTISQSWLASSQVNAQQSLLYQSLYTTPPGQSPSGMC
jgi:hypothetical protein